MKKSIILVFAVFVFFSESFFACVPVNHQFLTYERFPLSSCGSETEVHFYGDKSWFVAWSDSLNTSVTFRGLGGCMQYVYCDPYFSNPTYENGARSGKFKVQITNKWQPVLSTCQDDFVITKTASHTCQTGGGGGGCLSGLTTSGEKFEEGDPADLCSPCNPDPWDVQFCQQSGGTYDYNSCQCGQSPIVIDVLGNGFNLTNAQNGVSFDINGDGTQDRIAWSSANSDDAWLALDRNGNGTIDSGKELFGNSTQQPAPPAGEMKNGFLALAVFDKVARGGNGDGTINRLDTVFDNLRLWQDLNHNGISEAGELKTLTELELAKIDLDYQESKRTDENGNRFKYKAKVRDTQDAQLGRWAWDVYLVVELPNN